jgi:hypothetical protein
MRRIALLFALLAALLAPASVSAGSEKCSLTISPTAGSPTDVYRFTVSNVPVDDSGGPVEARIDIRRLGTREGSVYFVFLIPGVTQFYVDHNYGSPEEPAPDPLPTGRYLVEVVTPHLSGPTACHAMGQFVVR